MQNVRVDRDKWRDIPGYRGLYQASALGEVRSIPRRVVTKAGWVQTISGGVLHQKSTKDGYLETTLYKNGHRKDIRVHRLIAMAFLGVPSDKLEVNHKDGNKKNNKIENLEWVTSSENQIHAYKLGLQKPSGGAIANRKMITCVSLDYTAESLASMMRYLKAQGFAKSDRVNRISELSKNESFRYLRLDFKVGKDGELCRSL